MTNINKYRASGSSVAAAFVFTISFVVLVSGCSKATRHDITEQVPYYRFPNQQGVNNLRLVSIFTNPKGDSFEQGTLPSNKKRTRGHLTKPVAMVSSDSQHYYLLDNGRGVIYSICYDADGRHEHTEVLPRHGRTFPSAVGMALSPDSILWVTDSRLKSLFRISSDGTIIDSISGYFERPIGITYHPAMNRMLVTDLAANSVSVISISGRLEVTHSPESGLEVEAPSFISVGPGGDIYIVEALTALVKSFDKDWKLKQTFGGLGDGPGFFAKPKGIAVDRKNRIYVADALFDNVQIFDRDSKLLLTLGTTGSGVAQFWQPMGISIGAQQQILISDTYNQRVQIFRWEEKIQ